MNNIEKLGYANTESEDMKNFATKSDLGFETPPTGVPPNFVEDTTPPIVTTINTEKQMPPIIDSNTPAAPAKGMSTQMMNTIWFWKEIAVGAAMLTWVIVSLIVMARKK